MRMNSIKMLFMLVIVMLIGVCYGNNNTDLSYEQNKTIEVYVGTEPNLSQIPILVSGNTVLPITLSLPVKTTIDNFTKREMANKKATRYNKNRKNKVAPKPTMMKTEPTKTIKTEPTKQSQNNNVKVVKRTNLRNGYVANSNKKNKTSRNLRGTEPVKDSVYNPPNRYCYSMLRSIKALVKY